MKRSYLKSYDSLTRTIDELERKQSEIMLRLVEKEKRMCCFSCFVKGYNGQYSVDDVSLTDDKHIKLHLYYNCSTSKDVDFNDLSLSERQMILDKALDFVLIR